MNDPHTMSDDEIINEYSKRRAELDEQYYDGTDSDYRLVMKVDELESEIDKRKIQLG